MSRYSNQMNIPLPLAVFLATDDYDYDPTAISATALLRPIRQTVLTKRVNPEDNPIDIAGLVSSRMGSAIHAAIEKAWLMPRNALKALGVPKKVVNNIVINPSKEMLQFNPDAIPVYMEQRAYKQVGKYKVSGKFDFVAEGRVQDPRLRPVPLAQHAGRRTGDPRGRHHQTSVRGAATRPAGRPEPAPVRGAGPDSAGIHRGRPHRR